MFKIRSLASNVATVTAILLVIISGMVAINVYVSTVSIREVYFSKEAANKERTIDEGIVNEARKLLED